MSALIPATPREGSEAVSTLELEARRQGLARLDRIATLMDDQFEIPLLGWRVGLDPLLGLLPGAGDWVVCGVSLYIFWSGLRMGARTKTLGLMAFHIALDLIGGTVPAVGDVFDVLYRSNRRNVELLRRDLLSDAIAPAGAPGEALAPRQTPAVRYGVGVMITLVLVALALVPFGLLLWAVGAL